MTFKNPKRPPLVFLTGLLFILIVAGHRVSFSATPDEVEAYLTEAITANQISGEPYELDGSRIVFTNYTFIRPGNVIWQNEAGEMVNIIEENDEDPIYGPWDAQFHRPSSPYGIELKIQAAERKGPILNNEMPWEAGYVIFKTVLKDGDVYKAWGKARGAGDCYFESEDGIHWERPILDLKEFNGSRQNNLLAKGPQGTVFIDPIAPPNERYKSIRGSKISFDEFKAFIEAHPDKWETRAIRGPWREPSKIRGISGAVSSDGIHWTHKELFTIEHSDGMETAWYDLHRKKYIVYTRTWVVGDRSDQWTGNPQTRTWPGEFHGSGRRAIGVMESDTFGNFDLSRTIIEPVPSEVSPSEVFYTSIHSTIPDAPEQHLMFVTVWDTRDDTCKIEVWSSRDGLGWARIPGPPILETANFGEWDGGSIFSFPSLIELPNGDFALPYKGYNLPHKYPRGHMTVAPGYAIWPKGRIVAVEADEIGEFSTVGIIPPGRNLRINALTKRAGGVRVEVANINDEAFPGRSFDDCDPIQGDQFWSSVTWNGQSDLGYEEGDGVVIRFKLDRAQVFGIEFE